MLFLSNDNDSTTTTTTTTAAQDLLDKAAKIRAEIAAMEGKTLEEVEKEAKEKKESEVERRRIQEEENVAAAAKRAENTKSQDNGRFLFLPLEHPLPEYRQSSLYRR